jgi:hypothetical protein
VFTGTVFAPNGKDPIPRVRVYIPKSVPLVPFPANYCDQCLTPIDPAWVSTITAADGTFTLDVSNVPEAATLPFAIQIGRFRKYTMVPVTCGNAMQTVTAAAETLPGNSAAGDIPKILVSSGNVDHLDAVLSTLGSPSTTATRAARRPARAPRRATRSPTRTSRT